MTFLKKIAFQGELGAYSHLALQSVFKGADAIPCLNFKNAMDLVSHKQADAAIIPVENSQYGRVSDVHFLLPTTDLHINGEFFHRVQHKLLGIKGSHLSDITHVHSHPQALGQCASKIRALGLIPMPAYDTAGAAKMIAHTHDISQAAIASQLAGEIYGLDILQSDFEDTDNNTTRFIVMQREDNSGDYAIDNDTMITAFIFKTRNIPAALYKVLGGFATNAINMLRLESYVDASHFTSSCFYAEIKGHKHNPVIERAFEELQFFATDFKILGCFVADDFRIKS
jgi:prephenate dehydratase